MQQLFQEKFLKFIFSCFYADADRRSIFVGSRIRLINSYDDDDNDDDDDDDNTSADDILKSALLLRMNHDAAPRSSSSSSMLLALSHGRSIRVVLDAASSDGGMTSRQWSQLGDYLASG